MQNIFNEMKKRRILVFVIAHITEVKLMDVYDKKITFEEGTISLVK
jgi:hypothetical protein